MSLNVYEIHYEKAAPRYLLAESSREACLLSAKTTTTQTGGVIEVRDADENKRYLAEE